jgi:hypothetical protein
MKKEFGYVAAFAAIMVAAILFVANHFKSDVVSSKMVEVELLHVSTSTKHLYVDIRDLSTGVVYRNISVPKCGGPNDFPYSFPFLVTRVERRYVNMDNEIKTQFEDLDTGMEWSKQFKIKPVYPFKY